LCVVVAESILVGLRPTQHFRQRFKQNCNQTAIATAEQSRITMYRREIKCIS